MKRWSRYLVGVVAVTGLALLVTRAGAETCTLEMKKLESSPDVSRSGIAADLLFRSTYPQRFFQQLGGPPMMAVQPGDEEKPPFSEVIQKEPAEYASDTPFRGVASLGTQHYGFVLDTAPPKEEPKEEAKADAENSDAKKAGDEKDSAQEEKEGEKPKSEGGILSALSKVFSTPLPSSSPPEVKARYFTRLYFDRNHNGDLTDDVVIESDTGQPGSMNQASFPVVDLTIDVGGKKVDYAFRFSVYSYQSGPVAFAHASLNGAAYRDGQIMLDGKNRRVVLVDYNSNGRFDDTGGVNDKVKPSDGTVYPTIGDFLFIDPLPAAGYPDSYTSTGIRNRYQVNKLIAWGDRFYDVTIDPSGDTLTLEPSTVPVGHLSNPNKGFRAVVYGDRGVLEIDDQGTGKAPVPEGQWKLMSYTIEHLETAKPEEDAEKQEKEKKEETASIVDILGSMLPSLPGSSAARRATIPRPSMVSARAKADFTEVQVGAGETAEMRFGPPYQPKVEASNLRKGMSQAELSMSLVGAGGEVCNSLRVNGGQPSAPEFTISTKDGVEVASGKFQYG